MKILYITPDFQHPNMPGSHRCYHIIKKLSVRHDITLFTLVQQKIPNIVLEDMKFLTDRIFMYGLEKIEKISVWSKFLNELNLQKKIIEMKAALKKLTDEESFDVILFHGKFLYKLIEKCSIPIVIDFCDATSMRLLLQMRNEKLKKFSFCKIRYLMAKHSEKQLLKKSDQVVFISNRDQNAIFKSKHRGKVIPNGVDLKFWKNDERSTQKNTLAFTGVMSYPPNENAAKHLIEKIMPPLRKAIDNPHLLLIGNSPSFYLQKTAEIFSDITVTGYVKDVRPFLKKASIFAAPIHFASGMQNKVLEAMAMKLPVVTTSIVADGLKLHENWNLPVLVANDETEFVMHIISLLKNDEKRDRLAAAGQRFVANHFDWNRSAIEFEKMCIEAVENDNLITI